MTSNASKDDCICPVCCDLFKDPVILSCHHSFCKFCLQEWWKQSKVQICPVCKELFPMNQPLCDLTLKNQTDTLRCKMSQMAMSGSEQLCSLHNKELNLSCQDDQQLICVICRDAQKHQQVNCVPISEAVEDHRTQLRIELMHLKTKHRSFSEQKLISDKMASHIEHQAQQTEKTIREEFQKLYRFLRAEEAARIDAVRKEATLKSEAMNIRIVNLNTEISSLTDKIKTIEQEVKTEDVPFMKNVKTTMEQSQYNLSEPETPSGALIDEAKHVGNLLFTVWKKIKSIIKYTPVILDPNTGSSYLTTADGLTCSIKSGLLQPLPENPERLHSSAILGSEGFSSGKHSWDVELSGYWTVGVAAKTKDHTSEKIWGIYVSICTYFIHECTPEGNGKMVSEDLVPKQVRVQLDYDQGLLSFFDLDRKISVHTIKYTFTDPVFPYFGDGAKILPAEVSVKVKQEALLPPAPNAGGDTDFRNPMAIYESTRMIGVRLNDHTY